jgi:sugar lactone lactonase YvrE
MPRPIRYTWFALGTVALMAAWPATVRADLLYVSNYNHATVTELSAPGVGGTYASGVASPTGLAFDAQGDLFVGNSLSGTITEIAPGGMSSSVFASGLNRPEGLAFDRNGILFVANYGSGVVSQVTPSGAVSIFAYVGPQIGGLAFDSSGNLFVSGGVGSNAIFEVTPSGTVSTFANGGGLAQPFGLAFDSLGNLYVGNTGGGGSVSKITPGGSISTFASGGLLTGSDYGVAVDQADNVFVANFPDNSILEITPGGTVSEFTSGLDEPDYLAFRPRAIPEPSGFVLSILGMAILIARRSSKSHPEPNQTLQRTPAAAAHLVLSSLSRRAGPLSLLRYAAEDAARGQP